MKSLQFCLASAFLAGVAVAQDASDIERAQGGGSCEGCNLFQATLSYQDISGVSFADARLRQADLSLATMDDVDFSDADLSIANLFGGRFSRARFTNADLSNATLVGAYFGRADFTGAQLAGANLGGSDFRTSIGLTQDQLDSACGDESTLLPPGMKTPHC